jgi:hypothetical protein
LAWGYANLLLSLTDLDPAATLETVESHWLADLLSYCLTTIVVGVIIGWLGVTATVRLYNLRSDYPGPFFAKITTLWKFNHLRSLTYLKTVKALHNKYGKVVQVAPYQYSVRDRSKIRVVLAHDKASCAPV